VNILWSRNTFVNKRSLLKSGSLPSSLLWLASSAVSIDNAPSSGGRLPEMALSLTKNSVRSESNLIDVGIFPRIEQSPSCLMRVSNKKWQSWVRLVLCSKRNEIKISVAREEERQKLTCLSRLIMSQPSTEWLSQQMDHNTETLECRWFQELHLSQSHPDNFPKHVLQ
jgi:hypothetical protein